MEKSMLSFSIKRNILLKFNVKTSQQIATLHVGASGKV